MGVKFIVRTSIVRKGLVVFLLSCVLFAGLFYQAGASSNAQSADEGEAIFNQTCKACHTIGGGDLVGPDLEGVLEQRDLDWLRSFISAPDEMIADGDPIAIQLLEEFNNIPMPNLALSETDVESLLTYLEGGGGPVQETGPLPDGDSHRGEELFTGGRAFQNNGTPCIGCHTVGNRGILGGGNLGPDLTHVSQRFGKAGLASSIKNIAFPTMQGVYAKKPLTDQEVSDLVAYFAGADAAGMEGAASMGTVVFWIAGALGAAALFGLMAIFLPGRRENISDRLRKEAGITSRSNS